MDILLLFLGFIFMIIGLLGTFLPVIPGPPLAWLALVCLYSTKTVENNPTFLIYTLLIALAVTVLDYIVPIWSTKKLGGTKWGTWGATAGLIIGLFLGPIGIIMGPFFGALIGELINDSKDTKKALKSASGSFIGFLIGTIAKLIVCIYFLVDFIKTTYTYKSEWF